MPWVRFTEDFEFRVKSRVILLYYAGSEHLVKAACAEEAVKAGKAVRLDDGHSERSKI